MDSAATRRRLLRAALAGATVSVAGCVGGDGSTDQHTESPNQNTESANGRAKSTERADQPTSESMPDSVGLETLASGLQRPIDVVFAPDADRRYVVEQPGLVLVHEEGGIRDQPFLDLRDSVEVAYERGLLGVAFHPNFAENRRVFVRYSDPQREDTPESYNHTFVLAEFEATEDGRRAKPDSERTILEIPEPQGNHNAGDIVFGPDGYLFVAVGDGGAGGDQGNGHVEDWYDAVQGGNGQDVTQNLLGSILRIDVDSEPSDGKNYAIPEDNPLVGREGLDEHYAWGFRNPWQMSFDGSDFFVADVGQADYEEVNLVEKGKNYGWNVREGAHCFRADDCPTRTPDSVRGGEPLVDPVIEYPHSGAEVSGSSVIGGNVYRGSALPGLIGTYVFGDLSASGRLFVAMPPEGGASANSSSSGTWSTGVLDVVSDDANKLQQTFSFGQDSSGEMYVLGSGANGGGLHKIVPAD